MKFIYQFAIIIGVSFAGEVLKYFIPLPVPASIYGLIIMLILLMSGALKVSQIESAADFLIKIMPLMFIPAVCGLTESYKAILPQLGKLIIVIAATTIIVMAVCGHITQLILRITEGKNDE